MENHLIKDVLGIVQKYFCDSKNYIENENYEFVHKNKNISININIVHKLIKNGYNNWNTGLLYACRYGNIDIVKLMIEKGATNDNNGFRPIFNHALYNACLFNSGYNIVKYMIEIGADNYNEGLYYACRSRNLDIINLLIDKGANDWNCLL